LSYRFLKDGSDKGSKNMGEVWCERHLTLSLGFTPHGIQKVIGTRIGVFEFLNERGLI